MYAEYNHEIKKIMLIIIIEYSFICCASITGINDVNGFKEHSPCRMGFAMNSLAK